MYKRITKHLLLMVTFSILVSCNTKVVYLVYKDVNLIPMTSEKIIESVSVHISNGKIIAIDKYSNLELPEYFRIIDGRGKYLTPGFSDMHVHLQQPEDLDLFIVNGVTTVRNMWGSPEHLKGRKDIKNGKIIGPELFTTGPLIDGPNMIWPDSFVLSAKEDVEKAIRSMKKDGYDFIKVYDGLSLGVYSEIIRVAKDINIPVVGHVPKYVGLTKVIQSGQQSIEHLNGYHYKYKDKYNDIKEQEIQMTIDSGLWNCPTIIVLKTISLIATINKKDFPELKYVNPTTVKYWSGRRSYKYNYIKAQSFIYNLYKQGGLIVSGTDANNPFIIAGFSLHDELKLLNEAGLTPFEVLLTTTVNPSLMLGISDRTGTIEVGKDADLVLLNKNPLDDITNTKTIAGVMSKGRWFPKEKIDKILKNVEDKMKKLSETQSN